MWQNFSVNASPPTPLTFPQFASRPPTRCVASLTAATVSHNRPALPWPNAVRFAAGLAAITQRSAVATAGRRCAVLWSGVARHSGLVWARRDGGDAVLEARVGFGEAALCRARRELTFGVACRGAWRQQPLPQVRAAGRLESWLQSHGALSRDTLSWQRELRSCAPGPAQVGWRERRQNPPFERCRLATIRGCGALVPRERAKSSSATAWVLPVDARDAIRGRAQALARRADGQRAARCTSADHAPFEIP